MESASQSFSGNQNTKPTPNPISGEIINLIYQGNSNNLVEIEVREINFDKTFTLTAYCNVEFNYDTVKIANLHDFTYRLQEAFNYRFVASIYHQDGKIVSLEIKRPNIFPLPSNFQILRSISQGGISQSGDNGIWG
ncbi:MAG: hypothetical protein AAGE96_17555 [Cyanobacteria bacterium P01_G01_bin.19]